VSAVGPRAIDRRAALVGAVLGGAAVVVAGAGLGATAAARGQAQPGPVVGEARTVTFTDYTPLSSNLEMARRLMRPLTVARLPQVLAEMGKGLKEQPIDLMAERFLVYVPPRAPAKGYGLLVFAPPWDGLKLPEGWEPVLDQSGVIFVAAARSGNDQNVQARREPLALLAAANALRRYPVDPERVYVGGFSGGGRVAVRLALGYPDLFRGALLNAGSDPIGDVDIPLPPRELFDRFVSSSRLVYATGERDEARQAMDAVSQKSMQDACMFNVVTQTTPWTDHAVASPAVLARALKALDQPMRVDAGKLAACRARLDAEVARQLQQVRALAAQGKIGEASGLLESVDKRFGGLAAPQSVELQAELRR
jgi:predicted esterase